MKILLGCTFEFQWLFIRIGKHWRLYKLVIAIKYSCFVLNIFDLKDL